MTMSDQLITATSPLFRAGSARENPGARPAIRPPALTFAREVARPSALDAESGMSEVHGVIYSQIAKGT